MYRKLTTVPATELRRGIGRNISANQLCLIVYLKKKKKNDFLGIYVLSVSNILGRYKSAKPKIWPPLHK